MECGECIYDFDLIDAAERSPLNASQDDPEEGLKTSKSWCGPLSQLIGQFMFLNITAWWEK